VKKSKKLPSIWTAVFECDIAYRGSFVTRDRQVFTVAGGRGEARRALNAGIVSAFPNIEGGVEMKELEEVPRGSWDAFLHEAWDSGVKLVMPHPRRITRSVATALLQHLLNG
jgi:hypothetical protein